MKKHFMLRKKVRSDCMIKKIIDSLEYESGDLNSIINALNLLRLQLEENNLFNDKNLIIISNDEKVTKMILELISLSDGHKIKDKFISKLISLYYTNPKDDYNLLLLSNLTDKNVSLLVEANMPLVRKIALQYARDDFELEDFISCGSLGLLHAIKNFDIIKNCKFSTYAFKCIKGFILREIYSNRRTIKLSADISEKIKKYKKFYDDYYMINGYYPSDDLICDTLELTIEDLSMVRFAMLDLASLNVPISDDGDTELVDFVADTCTDVVEEVENNELISKLKLLFDVACLNEIEKFCLIHKFGVFGNEVMSFSDIAKRFSVTTEYVRQSYDKALKKLKDCPVSLDIASIIGEDVSKRHEFGRGRFKKNGASSIFDKFSGYSKNEILIAISKLPAELLDVIHKKYGNDLVSYCNPSDWDNSLNNKLYLAHNLISKFLSSPSYKYRKKINGKKNLFDRLELYKEEDIILAVKSLNEENLKVLKIRYGENLDDVFDTDNSICSKINSYILPLLKRKLLKYSKCNDIWDNIFNSKYIVTSNDLLFLSENCKFLDYIGTLDNNDKSLIICFLNDNINDSLYDKKNINEAIKCILFGYYLYLVKNNDKSLIEDFNNNIKVLVLKSL